MLTEIKKGKPNCCASFWSPDVNTQLTFQWQQNYLANICALGTEHEYPKGITKGQSVF